MSKKLLLSVVSVLLIAFGSVSTVYAQGATGVLGGRVVDESGRGVAGVTVNVTDARTGLSRTISTASNGNFKMQLPPGNYTLKSSGSGINSVTIESVMVNLGVASDLTIPVVSSGAAIEEIVTYGSATELMDATTGETGLNISLEELTNVPIARNIESVALLAPGTVAGDTAFGDDKTLVSFGGASVAENVYYIDGLNVTNFRNGLGGSSVPFEFYDQFQIKTGGYGAEFGRSTGGVINAVTKRGSNEFEYGVVTYFAPTMGQGKSPGTIRADGSTYDFNNENEQDSFTTDLYVSGPIIRDRLFFYVLYEPQDTESKFTSLGSPNTYNVQTIDDDFWGGNLTWNINDNHSLSYTAFTDERKIFTEQYDYDFETTTVSDFEGSATNLKGGDNNIVRYEGSFGDNLSVSAMWGKNEYNLTAFSSNDAECPLIIDLQDGATDVYGAGSCWVESVIDSASTDEREAIRLDVEYYLGDHTLRAGFDREDNFSVGASVYPGFDYNPGAPGGIYYRYETYNAGVELSNGGIVPGATGTRVNTVRTRYFENGGSFDTIQQAWYLEDKWAVTDEFTVSLGIRNEKFENLNNNGEPFIEIDDQWAPRLAFEWAPGGSGDQVVTLNWGRYHLPIAANTNVRLSGPELDFQRYFLDDGLRDSTGSPVSINADGIPTGTELGSVYFNSDGTTPNPGAVRDKNLDPMFQDEWILQYQRQLNENWSAGIRYIHRDLSSTIDDILIDHGLEAMEARGEFSGPIGSSQDCHYVLTNPGQDVRVLCEVYNTFGDPSSGVSETLEDTTIPAADLLFPEAERTYEAFEITLEGQVGELSVNGSYTWSKSKGNTEGYVKSDNGQDDAGITQDFDLPELMDGALGYLPNDRRHKLKLWASYQATDRLTLGATMFMQSGRPINAFGESHPDGTPSYGDTFYLQDADGNFTFVPRGTAGRTPWLTSFDVAAVYSFNWADRADIELRAEVFNLLNADAAREVYEFAESRPDQFRLPTSYQRPRYLRFGAAIRF